MGLKDVFYILLAAMLITSCEMKLKPNDEEEEEQDIEVLRYDRLESRYLTTGDFSALQQMNISYPLETRTLIEEILKLGQVNDPKINSKFLNLYQDSIPQTIIADAEFAYADMSDLNREFTQAFARLRQWFPNLHVPNIYAQITTLDQSVVVGNQSIGFSLDKYLGEDYPIYAKYYSEEQRKEMTREMIVPDCISSYLMSQYQMKDWENRSQLDFDMHIACVMWIANHAVGRKAYKSEFIDKVDKYMQTHKDCTYEQLLNHYR